MIFGPPQPPVSNITEVFGFPLNIWTPILKAPNSGDYRFGLVFRGYMEQSHLPYSPGPLDSLLRSYYTADSLDYQTTPTFLTFHFIESWVKAIDSILQW